MEVRDPVHGSIHIAPEEVPLIQHPFFERLRGIKQLGFTENIFPGATHTRFLHSIGVMEIAGRAFDRIFKQSDSEMLRLKETFKMACLLHDIGHAPLSHATEIVMPPVSELNLPDFYDVGNSKRRASHEDYTVKSISDSSFAEAFKLLEKKFGLERMAVAELVVGECRNPDYFTHHGLNYFPILHQLVSSELDCDRMDYLLRDSHFCGVSYGNFDLDWLLDNLEACPIDGKLFLGISERATSTFDDFLLSRFHMFVMVYFHYKSVCLEQLLFRYFESAKGEYRIPADIEKYQEHDDHYLWKILKNSSNKYAKSIVANKIPKKIFESFHPSEISKLEKIESYLVENKIEYIKCSTKNRLSKYYDTDKKKNIDPKYPIKVVRSYLTGKKTTLNIEKATDLFQRYSEVHSINRLHCQWEELNSSQIKTISDLINS